MATGSPTCSTDRGWSPRSSRAPDGDYSSSVLSLPIAATVPSSVLSLVYSTTSRGARLSIPAPSPPSCPTWRVDEGHRLDTAWPFPFALLAVSDASVILWGCWRRAQTNYLSTPELAGEKNRAYQRRMRDPHDQ